MLFAMLLALAAPIQSTADETARSAQIDAAAASIKAGRPQEAIDTLTPVIAAYEAEHASDKRHQFCGMSTVETLTYMTIPSENKLGAVAYGPDYCNALYLKGYALIDLGRIAEARVFYERVVALAPMHAHFITELGQSYRYEKNWPKMLETCLHAEEMVAFAGQDNENREKALAWHCQGYALSELGRLDEAEKRYRDSLALDPEDAVAKNELQYIAQQRAKK